MNDKIIPNDNFDSEENDININKQNTDRVSNTNNPTNQEDNSNNLNKSKNTNPNPSNSPNNNNLNGMNPQNFQGFNFMMPGVFDMSSLSEILPEEVMNFFENFKDYTVGAPMMAQSTINNSGNDDQKDNKNNRVKTKNRVFQQRTRKKTFLEQFAINLNSKARDGKIDRIVGRANELERVIRILNRRGKNNPVLIGEPGVGKTAIAEGLAVKIVRGEVPHKLLDAELHLLDLTSLIAGAHYRGQFEERIRRVIEEVEMRENVILVIDELHKIVGTGETDNPMNAANIIKPALAKGTIKIIGATTLDEYRKYIEKDSALERRFQPIIVDEPTIEEAVSIISGIKDYYEKFHAVKIPNGVVKFAVELSKRYINDRFLPDKAIDLIDEAGSIANLSNDGLNKLSKLQTELSEIQKQKASAVSADSIEEYKKAADLKTKECQLMQEIQQLNSENGEVYLSESDVANVVQSWTKIPMTKITKHESDKLKNIESEIKYRVIGQDEAVDAVARAIRIHRAGISVRKGPASFMFVGPSGVGKTELARVLSKELFVSEDALIRLDMSEYMEKHSVSKIIGAPPGYIGYDEAGQLTEKVRRKPYSLILFDEIEKAHIDVVNILLQILEDGRITDSKGRLVNFENTIIIMTSNAGSGFKAGILGFAASENKSIQESTNSALKELFKPEFLNRIDEVIVFNNLTKSNLMEIAKILISDLTRVLKEKNIEADFSDNVIDYITENGFDPKYGARPMYRIVKKYIESQIAHLVVDGTLEAGGKIFIDYIDGQFTIRCIAKDKILSQAKTNTDNSDTNSANKTRDTEEQQDGLLSLC